MVLRGGGEAGPLCWGREADIGPSSPEVGLGLYPSLPPRVQLPSWGPMSLMRGHVPGSLQLRGGTGAGPAWKAALRTRAAASGRPAK